jgi:hypothetical protein
MRAEKLSNFLRQMIRAKENTLITGPAGCGKSALVAQATELEDADYIPIHPVICDPTDFKGMPYVGDGEANFLPYGDSRQLINAERLTVCNIEDLGQSPVAVQASLMQVVWAKRIGVHRISDHVVFIGTTNRREDRAGVNGLLEPLKSRFTAIVEFTPSVEDWSAWALANGQPIETVAFARFKPGVIIDPPPITGDIVNRPSARTLTALGRLWNLGVRDPEALGGAVGQGTASEFLAFARIFAALPSIDGIILDPKSAKVPDRDELAVLCAVSTALATRANKENFGRIISYLERLPVEYNVMAVRDSIRKNESLQNTKADIEWAVKHQDVISPS